MKTHQPHIVPKYVTYGFFLLGFLSAVAFRAIIVLQRMEPNWVRPVWYIGTVGYLLFFLYRFEITKKRKKAISDYGPNPPSISNKRILGYFVEKNY
jgi:hypothetical protein